MPRYYSSLLSLETRSLLLGERRRSLLAAAIAGCCAVALPACGAEAPLDMTSQGAAQPTPVMMVPSEMPSAAQVPPEPAVTDMAAAQPPPVVGDDGAILAPEDLSPAPTAQPLECASAGTPASLKKVVLAFVFDVSASMGSEFEPFHSRALKWDPVVAATKAFFSDAASAGLSASLTFFPNEFANLTDTIQGGGGGMDPTAAPAGMVPMIGGGVPPGGMQQAEEVCLASEYQAPDVPLTPLPSEAFAAAIDAVTPPDELTWRLSTPTLPALEGTIAYIDELSQQDPNASYTIVLVTDGMPALCPGADTVEQVAQAVGAVADRIPTYVIGVENPITEEEPNPPPSVGDMDEVAARGGTEHAYIIDTTDPSKTVGDFTTVINQIRETSFTCSLGIPQPPAGLEFNKELVNVEFSTATGAVPYEYDPDCTGTAGWRFDSEEMPTSIELCPTACDALRAGLDSDGGDLSVQFGCERRGRGSL